MNLNIIIVIDYYRLLLLLQKEREKWMDGLQEITIREMDYKRDGLLIKDYYMDGLQDYYYYYYQRERKIIKER